MVDTPKALQNALDKINKDQGKGAIMYLGDKGDMTVETIPTGILPLDEALGVGGLPRGRIVELYGNPSAGKSTVALSIVAEAQRLGGICAYVDAEYALDPKYAGAVGVSVEDLLISQPDNGEKALEIVRELIRSKAVSVIVIDSVAALVPAAVLAGDISDSHVGQQARMMAQALQMMVGEIKNSNTIVIFINQLRDKIGAMGFGPKQDTPGGRALKFYSSIRMEVVRVGSTKDGEDVTGNKTRVKLVKNKIAPPFTVAEFEIEFGKGVSKEAIYLDRAVDAKIVTKSGTWFTLRGQEKPFANGRENAKEYLHQSPDDLQFIIDELKVHEEKRKKD